MRGFLLASIVIAVAAVSAPGLFSRYMGGPDAFGGRGARNAVAQEAMALERAPDNARRSGRQFEVAAARDGHFYIDAEINFRRVRFIVDTGATVVALRETDAETAGIRLRPDDFRHPVQTANGTTNAAEALLDSVGVADIEVRNVRALVLPDDQLSVSLLGGSFLNGLQRYEVADGTLIMEN